MKYPNDYINKIICGDCIEVMKSFPDNCIDTIITDPPYGIGFMGKEWDNFKLSFIDNQKEKGNEDYLKNIKRKQQYPNLKGRKLSPIGTRSSISGSYDLSPKGLIGFQEWTKNWATQALRIAKPGTTLLCFGGTRTYHRLACAIEDAGWILKDCIMWIYGSGFPKAMDISKQLQKQSGKKPKIIGRNPNSREKCDKSNTLYESGTVGKTDYITEPTDKNATLWNGWKSHGLKPAYETILVCMKPNEGSYANNALKWGVAGLNIDGGRVGFEKGGTVASNPKLRVERGCKTETGDRIFCQGELGKKNTMVENVKKGGRYPANVILDEEAGRMLDEQSGERKPPWGKESESKKDTSWFSGKTNSYGKLYRDTGGASRFFYCAKASKAERNRGCEELYWEKDDSSFGYHQTDKHRWEWLGKGEERIYKETGKRVSLRAKGNIHPTVKSLALMKYLVKLTLMPNSDQIYLDLFCGSGTTLMACKELKRKYIGIDNIPEYCEISIRRIKAIPENLF